MALSNEHIEAIDYYNSRIDILGDKWSIVGFDNMVVGGRLMWGLRCTFGYESDFGTQYYQSVYVFTEYRRQGLMTDYVNKCKHKCIPFITMKDCNIESFFTKHQVPYLVAG